MIAVVGVKMKFDKIHSLYFSSVTAAPCLEYSSGITGTYGKCTLQFIFGNFSFS